MSKRHYSSPDPRSPRRFQKMPRSSGKRTHEKLPAMPSTAGLLLSMMEHLRREWKLAQTLPLPDSYHNAVCYAVWDVEALYRMHVTAAA